MENKKLFQKMNNAFATGDVGLIIENVAENIQWNMVGNSQVEGKRAVMEMMEPMRGVVAEEYVTKNIITGGNAGVIEGTMLMPMENGEKKTYAFCDIYKLDQDGKIEELTAYLIEMT
ncbi:nuclear transport factor 2 family protein [Salicibibacter cibarius]|uniref:Nuclear transport factor 2 family protein n=1 Tax=Salicibibacter cibarius TaxID=2743000 RepID=A0A7T6Z0U1_9BACI|nr:nuclear transport factor 2 family protein [Salicibibacter cibarius]QQK74866.1 nuclear transport factor 2 family protein [Salicibibacter cibarius]